MPRKMGCLFLLTLTIPTLSIKIFGDVPMSVVFWKIHGIRLQKKPLVLHLLQRKLQIRQNTLILSLVKVSLFPSMEKG